jgi:predicted Fe-Mo cluster-binding NifX family protein
MKIAITTKGGSLESELDPRFGRAQFFIIVDTETGESQVVSNDQNAQASQGAGIQAGKNVVETGAEAVITGNVGPKAFRTLQAAGIKIYLCPGESVSVQEALDRFGKGELQEVSEANVSGHWM